MEKTEWIFEATLVRVVDGDTIVLMVDQGFDDYSKISFRLLGVDTPEVYGVKRASEEFRLGKLASQFAQDWFDKNGHDVVIQSFDARKKLKTGKYGRWLAYIYPRGDSTEHLNGALIAAGHDKHSDD